MWYERSQGRSPFGKRVVAAYIGVSLLHALYDISVSTHILMISFVSGTQVPLPGLLFGLVGLAVLVVMVRVVRRGGDPVESLLKGVRQLQGAMQSAPRL